MLNVAKHWRLGPVGEHGAFDAHARARPLRIVLDDATAPAAPAGRLLRAFASRPGVELFATAPDAPQRIELGAPDARGAIVFDYVLAAGGGMRMALASSHWLDQGAQRSEAEFGVPRAEAMRVLSLAAACARHSIDAFVCGSPPARGRSLARSRAAREGGPRRAGGRADGAVSARP
jgi:hypothetical protein